VFRRVCSKCHSLTLFKPSDLRQLGYTNSQISIIIGDRKLNKYYQFPLLKKFHVPLTFVLSIIQSIELWFKTSAGSKNFRLLKKKTTR
ncbi:MAG: hypothetical protein ACTS4Y_01960, partial [Candidatus Hodgkinia cicadicola]